MERKGLGERGRMKGREGGKKEGRGEKEKELSWWDNPGIIFNIVIASNSSHFLTVYKSLSHHLADRLWLSHAFFFFYTKYEEPENQSGWVTFPRSHSSGQNCIIHPGLSGLKFTTPQAPEWRGKGPSVGVQLSPEFWRRDDSTELSHPICLWRGP